MANSASESLVGQVVDGRHEITDVLGSGGIGDNYLAVHLKHKGWSTFKVLWADLVDSPEAQARLLNEIRALGQLQQRSIVRLLDFGSLAEGAYYLILEHVEGPSLGQIVHDRGPLFVADALIVLAGGADPRGSASPWPLEGSSAPASTNTPFVSGE